MAPPSFSPPFPGFSRVYAVGEPGVSRAFRASLEGSGGDDRAAWLALLRGELSDPPALRARWAMGAPRPQDLVWTTLAFPILVSARAVGVLRDGGFSGWDVVPVELRDRAGASVPGYSALTVRGRCGAIDDGRSERVEKRFPGGVFPIRRGLHFDERTWDGSDLFVPAGTAFVLALERVKRALEEAKVKPLWFTRLDELEMGWPPGT